MNPQAERALRRLLLVLLPSVICAAGAFAQSSFVFQNYAPNAGIDAPVFDEVGNRLFGTHYVAILYGGPTVDALAPARSVNPEFQMQPVPFTDLGNGLPGYFEGLGYVQITTVPCLGVAWLQVRAWDLRLGATYEEVAALAQGGYGQSSLFQARGGSECGLGTGPEPLRGLQSFSLVPEPSTVLLLLAGLPGLLLVYWHRATRKT